MTRSRKILIRLLAIGLVTLASLPAHARTWEYYFGTWLGGEPAYQPQSTFAYMSVSTLDSYSFDFVLRAYDPVGDGNLSSAFGAGAFISKAIFNSATGAEPIGLTNVTTNGYVDNISLGVGEITVGGIAFDFFDGLSGGNNLQAGEWIGWTLSFSSAQDPFLGTPPVALRVEGYGIDGAGSAWYTPASPVPEPETMAMLIAGLGLMGFVARRRQMNLAAA